MSRLFVLTRPDLVTGFQLAGIDAYSAEDVESAQELIESWWVAGEEGLLAIDDGLLEKMDPAFVKRMESAERIPYLAIPGGQPLGKEASRKYQIAEMIRRAIGFHITFKGEEEVLE
ncbi:MAG TPA: V-type ATP synthase subunit F [Anaerolineales bacterium]